MFLLFLFKNKILIQIFPKFFPDSAIDSFGAKGSVSQGRFRARILDISKLPKLEEMIKQTI